jgi:hypothetical protein
MKIINLRANVESTVRQILSKVRTEPRIEGFDAIPPHNVPYRPKESAINTSLHLGLDCSLHKEEGHGWSQLMKQLHERELHNEIR